MLYHLVLIGEVGYGTIEFLAKTEFGTAALKPSSSPFRVYPQNSTVIAYTSNSTDLLNATLQYSIDNWRNATTLDMEIVDNRTCRSTVPGQNAGTSVVYKVEANDVLKNVLVANGSYAVKYPSVLNLTALHESVYVGDNATVKGSVTPSAQNLTVTVIFTSTNETRRIEATTLEDGSFTASFQTEKTGTWDIQARFSGDNKTYPCLSSSVLIGVEEPTFLMRYSLYIGGGAAAAFVVGIVVYFKKFKE